MTAEQKNKKAIVIGAGVSGLTTGIQLQRSGYHVQIWTKDMPQETMSATAAAFWEPFLAEPPDKVARWGKVSYEEFERIAAKGPQTGVEKRPILSVFKKFPEIPEWAKVVPTFERMNREQLEVAFEGRLPPDLIHGFSFNTWMVEMPKYLAYLQLLFEQDGSIHKREIRNLQDLFQQSNLIVNCSALGSRDIEGIDDKTMYPVAGQVVQIHRRAEQTILVDSEDFTYIVPRGDTTILGGTAQKDNWDRTPHPATTDDIISRCMQFLPDIRKDDIQNIKVGLRPARSEVRLELEEYAPNKHLIHNYGHGGAGVTLSWGCADDVVKLAGASSRACLTGRQASP